MRRSFHIREARREALLGRLESVLAVQLRLLERQLDGVLDLFDLRAEASDILIGDVRNFFKQKMFDVRALDVFENEAVAQIREHGVADAQTVRVEAAHDVDTRFVLVDLDEDAARVNSKFDRHHRAGIFVSRNADDDELLLQPQLLSDPQRIDINTGRGGHVHLASADWQGIDQMVIMASGQGRRTTPGGEKGNPTARQDREYGRGRRRGRRLDAHSFPRGDNLLAQLAKLAGTSLGHHGLC